MLLLLGARGVVVATFTSHVLLFIRDRVFVWLLVCCCCLVEQFIEFGLHPQELHLSRSTRSEFLHGWCQKWDLLVAYLPRPTSVLLGTDVPQLVELLNGVGREPGFGQ